MLLTTVMGITFPAMNPVAFQVGPVAIHWYGLAYMAGFLVGGQLASWMVQKMRLSIDVNAALTAIMLGIIVGGRLGYVLFYDLGHYSTHLMDIIAVWKGGMSFHGGAVGAFLGMIWAMKQQRISIHDGLDVLALAATPGIFFGRIANFVNGELFGRVSAVPWAMVFPDGGSLPRHPSQLYEAVGEGVILGIILLIVLRYAYKPGRLFTTFVCGYAFIRFVLEFTRQPDTQMGFLMASLTMGQWLSIAMMVAGIVWTYGRIKHVF
jgi:phosphatidylglycerol:prolipoprotein diacylglycerol transferase